MILDPRTIWIFTVGVFLILVIILSIFRSTARDYPEFNLWFLSFIIYLIVFCLYSLRGIIWDFFSVIIANVLFIISTHYIFLGFKTAYDRKGFFGNVLINYFIMAVIFLLFFYFYFIHPDIRYRTLVINGGLGLLILRAALIPISNKTKNPIMIDWFAFSVTLTSAVFAFIRIGTTLFSDREVKDFYNDESLMLSLVNADISAIFGTFVFIFIVSHKVKNKLIHANNKLKKLTNCDELTGSLTRRRFEQIADQNMRLSRRTGNSLSLLIFDVDNFKHINDTYGHLTGDKILTWIAETCLYNLREVDAVGRFGGEEFLILLPGTDAETSKKVLRKIMKLLKNGLQVEQNNISVTISTGITELKEKDATIYDLISRADRCLYRAKNKGKNRFYICR